MDKHKSQMDELAQEMKLLNWHKLANEAALKAALISTKKMKTTEKRLPHQVTSSFQSQEVVFRFFSFPHVCLGLCCLPLASPHHWT